MPDKFLAAGKIVSTHGVRGEVKLSPACDGAEFLKEFKTLYIDGHPHRVQSLRPHKGMALILFEGVNTVEAAMALRGKEVTFARADADPGKGRIFVDDLLGLPVYDTRTERVLGALSDVLFLPAGEVWVVKTEGGDCMIPERGGFIDPVAPGDGRIVVHTIEGMLPDEN